MAQVVALEAVEVDVAGGFVKGALLRLAGRRALEADVDAAFVEEYGSGLAGA